MTAEHANVRPHSGAQANMAVYFALLELGDTVMGMQLDHCGHLTHGAKVNSSGKLYNFVYYGVDRETETIDFDEVERLAQKYQPKIIVAGYSAYPRAIDFPRFRFIADSVGAYLMMDMAHISGLIAGGAHPSPLPHAQIVTSTTQKSLRGPRGGFIMCTEEIAKDIDFTIFPVAQGGPMMHTVASKAVCFGQALKPDVSRYAHQVAENCQVLAAELSEAGMQLVSGGTDNHLILVDVTPLGITGRQAEQALEGMGMIANKNAIPYDPRPPRVTSGLRLGTPAITSRGMGTEETSRVASMVARVLSNIEDTELHEQVASEVRELTAGFPVPGIDD